MTSAEEAPVEKTGTMIEVTSDQLKPHKGSHLSALSGPTASGIRKETAKDGWQVEWVNELVADRENADLWSHDGK